MAGGQSHKPGIRRLAATGVFMLIATAVVAAPASLISAFIDFDKRNIAYNGIEGSLWRGTVSSLSVNGVFLGDVGYRMSPLSLLRLSASAEVQAQGGAVVGSGRITVGLGGRIALADADIDVDLGVVAPTGVFGEPAYGVARIGLSHLVLTQSNGCVRAEGTLWTNVLDAPAKRFDLSALPMSGDVACQGEALMARLAGENPEASASITAMMNPDLTYEISATAQSSDTDIASALRFFGFEDDNGALTYGSAGVFGGTGS